MRRAFRLALFLVPLLWAPSAHAYRLILVPTGQVLNLAQARLEYKRLEYLDGNLFRVDAGLPLGLELQGSFHELKGDDDPGIGGQLRLFRETLVTPALSVGIQDAGVNSRGDTTAYIVAGKSLAETPGLSRLFPNGLSVHAGLGTGLLRGLFLGAQAGISPTLRLVVEHDTRRVNAGLAWNALPRVWVKLELVRGQPAYGISLNVGL